MKKETLADKLARRTFESAAIQQSWKIHANAFGPLLENAFVADYPAKIHLCAALNRISHQDGAGGREKLRELQKHLDAPMDHAVWNFFMGLSHEAEGDGRQALPFYRESCRHEPGCFQPHGKLAKFSQDFFDFDTAALHWQKTADLAPAPAIRAIYMTNLAGCLTHMHRLEEAYAALMQSRKLASVQQGRDAVAAILYAAMGDGENAQNCLSLLAERAPHLEPGVRRAVEGILRGENPQFSAQPVKSEDVDAFWTWFAAQPLPGGEDLSRQLGQVFPFLDRLPQARVEGNTLFLADWYMTALESGYEALLARCPSEVKEAWQFEVVRFLENP